MYILNGEIYIPTQEEREALEMGEDVTFINWEDRFIWTPIEYEEE